MHYHAIGPGGPGVMGPHSVQLAPISAEGEANPGEMRQDERGGEEEGHGEMMMNARVSVTSLIDSAPESGESQPQNDEASKEQSSQGQAQTQERGESNPPAVASSEETS
jgi:hypothetical protein